MGILNGARSRFGKSYIGGPEVIAEQLAGEAEVQAADMLLVIIPNQLGVDFNAALLCNTVRLVGLAASLR